MTETPKTLLEAVEYFSDPAICFAAHNVDTVKYTHGKQMRLAKLASTGPGESKMITQDQVDAAREAVSVAASKGYTVYQQAKAVCETIEAEFAEQQAVASGINLDEIVCVGGNTFKHRKALSQLGLKWDAARKTWNGTRRQCSDLPSGCYAMSYAAASLQSMSYADSDC